MKRICITWYHSKSLLPWKPAFYSNSSFLWQFSRFFDPSQSVRNSMNMSINSNSSHLSPSHIHGNMHHFWAHTWKFDQLFYCWWNVSIVILSTNFSGILDVLSFFLQSKHNYNKYPGKYSMLYQAIVHIGRISLTL